jgi:DNA repair protein RecO
MDRHQQSDAIILKADPVGEIHRNLVLLCPSLGLIWAMAHGARSAKGRLKSLSIPFLSGRFFLYHDPVRKSWKVTDVQVQNWFQGLRDDLEKFYAASYMAEVVLKSYGGEPAAVHSLLLESLSALEAGRPGQFRHSLAQFIWRYLDLAGLQPSCESCSGCGGALFPAGRPAAATDGVGAWYDPGAAGFVCGRCRGEHAAAISFGSLAWLRTTQSLEFAQVATISLENDVIFALTMVFFRLLETSLGINSAVLESGREILKKKSQ